MLMVPVTTGTLSMAGAESDVSAANNNGSGQTDEASVATRFAPIRFLSHDEPNLPTNVDDFLAGATLMFYDAGCSSQSVSLAAAVTPDQLAAFQYTSPCGGRTYESGGTRSQHKQHSFYLADAPEGRRAGNPDSARWATYYHVYPNDSGGVTIQYWFFHPYNTGKTVQLPIVGKLELGFHGGDWEGFHLILDGKRTPLAVRLLGHTDLLPPIPWAQVSKEGDHPRILSDWGTHTSAIAPSEAATLIRQETWPTGHVQWPDGHSSPSGSLVNLGDKTKPLQSFLRYSGLWGSPGFNFHVIGGSLGLENFSSGYWGPAYNETGMKSDGFITVWCDGIADPGRALAGVRECYPSGESD